MLTPEQHAVRRQGIGGSEIAAVCGLNPWSKPIDVWLVKRGVAESSSSFHTERGNYLEDGFLAWYAARFKRKHIDRPGTLVHARHPLVIATPDAVADRHTVVEIKAPHWRTGADWGEPETDQVPDYYLPQTMWEMAVTGLQEADVVAFLDGDIRRYRVGFDQTLFEALLEQAERFWRDHVVTGAAPPEDGSESYSEYLARRFPQSNEPVEVTDEAGVVRMVEDYKAAAEAMEAAEERKRRARQALEKRIGTHAGIKGEWGSISFKHNRDTMVVDFKALVEALKPAPGLIEQFTKTRRGPRVFRPYFKKEQ
jgi:putative phage-type endonuclease